MTELIPSTLAALTGGYTAALAVGLVIDPSVIKLVEVVVGASVTITMGWIAYRTLSKKLDEVDKKAAVIQTHVNSEKTKADGEIAALKQEVSILNQVLTEKKETAALLAQSAATTSSPKKE